MFPEKREESKEGVSFQKREHSQRFSQVVLTFSQQIYDDRFYGDFNNNDGYDIEV